MKHLMILNPKRRHRSRKASATVKRRSHRRPASHKAHRKSTRRSHRKMHRSANGRFKSHRKGVRRTHRRSHRLSSGMSVLRTKHVYVRANPHRRRSVRARSNPFGGGKLLSQVKGLFSKENLTIAAGGVASTVLTTYLVSLKKADGTYVLPLPKDDNTAKAVKVAYALGIPVAGALAVRKFSPNLAKGMLYSGLAAGLIQALKQFAPDQAKTLGLGEYLQYTPMSALAATPGYQASTISRNIRPFNGALTGSAAFPKGAF